MVLADLVGIKTSETFFYRIPDVIVGGVLALLLTDLDSFIYTVTTPNNVPLGLSGSMTPRPPDAEGSHPAEWQASIVAPATPQQIRINAVAIKGGSEGSWTTFRWILAR